MKLLEELLKEKKASPITPEIEKEIKYVLKAAARKIEQRMKSLYSIDDEVYHPQPNNRNSFWELAVRFYSNGEVWKDRPGEEDDDHPEAVQSGFEKIYQILYKEVELSHILKPIQKIKPSSRGISDAKKGKFMPYLNGSEKGYVYLGIEYGDK